LFSFLASIIIYKDIIKTGRQVKEILNLLKDPSSQLLTQPEVNHSDHLDLLADCRANCQRANS